MPPGDASIRSWALARISRTHCGGRAPSSCPRRARLCLGREPAAAGGCSPSPVRRRAPNFSATATGSSIPPPSAASPIRRRSSCRMRATITAPGSPIRSRSARSPAPSPARSASMTISPRLWRWRTTSATRPSAIPAKTCSTRPMRPYGGFDHNAQALRIVTKLEHRYAEFDGLNLTWETLEGLVKHNGPLLGPDGTPIGRYAGRGLPQRDPSNMTRRTICGSHLFAGPRRRRRRLPTISPIMRMTSTTACAPGSSISRRLAEVDFLRRRHRRDRRALPGARTPAPHSRTRPPRDHRFHRGCDRRERRAAAASRACKRRRRARSRPTRASAFRAPMAQAARRDQALPLRQHVSPSATSSASGSRPRGVVRDLFRLSIEEPELMPAEWAQAGDRPRRRATRRKWRASSAIISPA